MIPIQNPILVAWTDSSLYGSEGNIIEMDLDLKYLNEHKVFSQGGSLIAFMDRNHLERVSDVPFSICDWRSSASKRVFHSTFNAETNVAGDTVKLAKYIRAYYCEIL